MSVKTRMLNHHSHRDQIRDGQQRRHALEAEFATFASAADRTDLRALLARYDDRLTTELRDILARQQAQAERTADRQWRSVGGR